VRSATAGVLNARSAGLGQLAKAINPDEALIEYMVMPDRTVIFVARRNRFYQMNVNVSASELAARVRVARGIAAKRGDIQTADNSIFQGLYELLIAPTEKSGALDNVTRIVIVPQGSLAYLPFAALMDSRQKYLSDRFAVLYAPSASAVMSLRLNRGKETPPRRAVVLAPFPQLLPSTVGEATEVRRSLSASRALIGAKADEAALRSALSHASIVHVASHGLLNRRNPLFSRIELARSNAKVTQSSADDGRLDLHEVFGLSVASNLVFLSGCETGAGTAWSTDFAHGDDFATLAQAFLYAGAQDVVATLWRIDDEAAALFASRFYRNLRQMPPADALAAAQADMRRNPKLKAPYYWAAYTLSGSGERLTLEKRWWNPFN
jgi:CHAT domain-containing protein